MRILEWLSYNYATLLIFLIIYREFLLRLSWETGNHILDKMLSEYILKSMDWVYQEREAKQCIKLWFQQTDTSGLISTLHILFNEWN